MKRLLLLLLLTAHSGLSQTLLVVIDPLSRGNAGAVLGQVLDAARQEGSFTNIVVREVPRWTRQWVTNDWPNINATSNEVARVNPDVLWIIGEVAPLITGKHIADGHEWRCIVTQGHNGISNFTVTDSTNHTEITGYDASGYPMNRNIAGDGRPDISEGYFRRPVAWLTFGGLTRPSDDTTFGAGCLNGLEKQPAIDEFVALRQYLTNDLAYRTGEWSTSATGIMTGTLWSSANFSVVTNSAAGSVNWTKTSSVVAGGTCRFYYENWDASEVVNFYDGGCVATRTLFDVSYRSYGMEVYRNYCPPFRRLNPGRQANGYGLVYLWSISNADQTFWKPGPSNVITADIVKTSADAWGTYLGDASTLPLLMQFYGDPTLPIAAKKRRGVLSVPLIFFRP